MRKFVSLIGCVVVIFAAANLCASAQTIGAKQGPDASTARDQEMERDSQHNLEVARHYFKLKKAYKAAVARCEEVIAGNPNFSHIDEVFYIAGISSLRLSENQGKQKTDIAPEKLRDDAREYLTQLVNNYPQSSFHDDAAAQLQTLGGAKVKQSVRTEKQ